MTKENAEPNENGTVAYIRFLKNLERIDEIHRAITRAIGRIEYLRLTAERSNSRLYPVSYGRGTERSRIEYAVLEADKERWGIDELEKELEALLVEVRPLIERLPAGIMRAVATQRILEGIPCGIIGKRMHFSRGYVYRLLNQSYDRLGQMYVRSYQAERPKGETEPCIPFSQTASS